MKLLLLGPVGSGKGTLAAKLSKEYNIPHISTGEIFRYNIQNNTELGKLAKPYVDSGELVPEELTFKIVEDRLSKADCENGFILDGYPRNMEQVNALDKIVQFDKVVYIYLSDEDIIARLSGRRMCRKCGEPTSIDWLKDGKCEKCGGEVYIRDDDKPEVIKVRLSKQAVALDMIEFYKNKGIFNQMNALYSVEDNYNLIKSILNK